MAQTLAEDLALLALDDSTGKAMVDRTCFDYGLAGAVLSELAVAGRVDVAGARLVAVDSTPLGDPLLDPALVRIAAEPHLRKPEWWVGQLAKGLHGHVVDRLVAVGAVRREETRILHRTRYPTDDRSREHQVRRRLAAVVLTGAEPDDRTAALTALVGACGLERKLFPDADRRAVRQRIADVSRGAWGAQATRKAVQAVQAAVSAAIIAGAVVAAGGSSG
jgi:hypothetical protein